MKLQRIPILCIIVLYQATPNICLFASVDSASNIVCTLTCNNITIQLGPEDCDEGSIVNYTVTPSGCMGGPIQYSGLPSGSFFPIGTTTNCFQAVDNMGNSATCCFDVTVNAFPIATTLACNDNVAVEMDNICGAFVDPNTILEGGPYGCIQDYLVAVEGQGSGIGGLTITSDAVGQILQVTITNISTGNSCNGTISFEDKSPPSISCPLNITISCGSNLPGATGDITVFDNCTSNCLETWVDSEGPGFCELVMGEIIRNWTATDESGNTAQCTQHIYVQCQSNTLTFPNVQNTQLTVRWINGSGDHSVVILSTNGSFIPPSNGIDPPAINIYNGSDQQVVYKGSDDEVIVKNLQPNTTYWFRVYSSNYCSGDPFYLLASGMNNTKSQKTGTTSDPASVIPFPILSPLPCIGIPGFYQSELHIDLYNAPKYMTPCIDPFKCNEINWYRPVINEIAESFCEVMPKAVDCFGKKDYTWEFRQRGHITGQTYWENNMNKCLSPCASKTCSSTSQTISHYSDGCDTRDDRRAWDVNYISEPGNSIEKDICVYAIADGDVVLPYPTNKQSLYIKHKGIGGGDWYSYYENFDPKPGLTKVYTNDHIGKIKNLGDNTHLHFGVYYKSGTEYISVNGPIKINDNNKGKPYTISNIHCTVSGSTISHAKVYSKRNNSLSLIGTTDEVGRLNVISIPGYSINDTIIIMAGGYEPLEFAFDTSLYNNTNFNVPLFKSGDNLLVTNPSLRTIPNSNIHSTQNIQLNISGENFNTYDIISINNYEDGPEYSYLGTNLNSSDSTFNLIIPNEGYNLIGIIFKGIDTVTIVKEIYYTPNMEEQIDVTIIIDSMFLNTNMYLNGNYFDKIYDLYNEFKLPLINHKLTFTRKGYKDTNIYISNDTVFNLLMDPLSINYSISDSTIIDFTLNGPLQYTSNVSLQDSTASSIISLKQYYENLSSLSLISKSRIIEFRNLLPSVWTDIKAEIVLDQVDNLSTINTYLLVIYNDTIYNKIFFDLTNQRSTYDSSSQKISYKYVDFFNGLNSKEAIMMMERKKPLHIQTDSLYIMPFDTITLPLKSIFTDPDSIKNDMNYILADSLSSGLSLTLNDGKMIITSSACEPGNITFEIEAEHDGLRVSNTISINILPSPQPIISAGGDLTFCDGDSVILNSSLAASYLWADGSTTQSISATSSGEYYLQTTDTNGCTQTSDTIHVIVHPSPPANIEVIGSEVFCIGDSSTLNSSSAISFNWNTGDTTQFITVKTSGEYIVTVTDTLGCKGISDTVAINVFDLPVVELGPNILDTMGTIVLDAGPGGIGYSWSTTETKQTIEVSESGWYYVTVTDLNDCSSTDSIFVSFLTGILQLDEFNQIKIYPNPNNGQFILSGEIANHWLLKVTIFNTMGQEVLHSTPEIVSGKFEKAIDLEHIIPGVYYVWIELDGKKYINRILII